MSRMSPGPAGEPSAPDAWAAASAPAFHIIAKNVTTRYLAITTEMVVGLLTLPFNLHHLGKEAYGLWMLTGSLMVHFSLLDMGYGGALVKFMAQYRAQRNARALNEIASTLFFVFTAVGVVAYLVTIVLALSLPHLFRLTPEEVYMGRWILLIIGLNVALNFPFSVFGGVVAGFQRYDANNVVAVSTSILVGLIGVGVLLLGYGVVPVVASTTAVRIGAFFLYRLNAYRIYPPLSIRWSLVRRDRLREVTGFSVYTSIIDWANKLNYQLDEFVIGAFIGTAPVAVWAVADRVISATQRLTNQLNGVLFPVVVESDTTNSQSRLQRVLLEGTRLSLATVLPMAIVLIVLAKPIVRAWVGQKMIDSAAVIQILAFAVACRVGNATGTTLLKGAGKVRYLAIVNIVTGIVNLALSAVLVRPFGLDGVAWGTLAPIAFSSIFVLFPAACRRVELPVLQAVRRAVWPAVWPAAVCGLLLLGTSRISSGTLLAVLVQAAGAGLLYELLFFGVAVGRADRAQYVGKLKQLLRQRPRLAPAA